MGRTAYATDLDATSVADYNKLVAVTHEKPRASLLRTGKLAEPRLDGTDTACHLLVTTMTITSNIGAISLTVDLHQDDLPLLFYFLLHATTDKPTQVKLFYVVALPKSDDPVSTHAANVASLSCRRAGGRTDTTENAKLQARAPCRFTCC